MELTEQQRQAVRFALTERVSVLTGGPGTGKTAVTKAIVELANAMAWQIALASPTGRAAKHMGTVSGEEAKTVHRLLGYRQVQGKWIWTHNKNNAMACELLIIDESSMLDVELAYRLLDAAPSGCHVVFIGDDNQLPSVGPGKVLADLIKSGKIPTTVLDKIHRQAEKSMIIKNAHLILHGNRPMFPPRLKGEFYHDSFFFEAPMDGKSEDVEWVKNSLVYLCQRVVPEKLQKDPFKDVQVLAPMKEGPAGVNAFNTVLQDALNPHGKALKLGFKEFRAGDRVMVTRNNRELDIYNGNVGILQDFDTDNQRMHIVFPDRELLYPFKDAKTDLQLAYCQTVHKVQGGEFPIVVFILLKRHYVMLQRNLLYTGATRPKEKIFYIGSRQAMEMAIRNDQIKERNSFLAYRLKK
jgi:exodeoxyribonuclease V alpha subunit